jgi:hypothetical protein
MIWSPRLRSVLTLKSSAALSPSAGNLPSGTAPRGRSGLRSALQAGISSASAQHSARARRRQRGKGLTDITPGYHDTARFPLVAAP